MTTITSTCYSGQALTMCPCLTARKLVIFSLPRRKEELDIVNRGEVYTSLVAKPHLIQRGEAEATRLGCAYSVHLSLGDVPRLPISTPFLSPTRVSMRSRGGAGRAARSPWTCMRGLCPHQGLPQETTDASGLSLMQVSLRGQQRPLLSLLFLVILAFGMGLKE